MKSTVGRCLPNYMLQNRHQTKHQKKRGITYLLEVEHPADPINFNLSMNPAPVTQPMRQRGLKGRVNVRESFLIAGMMEVGDECHHSRQLNDSSSNGKLNTFHLHCACLTRCRKWPWQRNKPHLGAATAERHAQSFFHRLRCEQCDIKSSQE